MNALETYPSYHHSKSDGNTDNYAHVARKFDRNTKCGTLSKSEWEAISKFWFSFMGQFIKFILFSRSVHGICLQENENRVG